MRVGRSTAVVLLIASLSLHYCYTFYTFDSSFVSFLIMTINCYARYIYGTEGTFYKNGGTTTSFHSYFNSTSTLPDPWRTFNPLNHQQDSSSIIYLSTFFLSGCVTFVTFFYGLLLKLMGRQQRHSPRPIPPARPKFDRYCRRLPRLPLLVALGALNTAATGATSSIYHLIFISIAPFSDAGLTRESYNPSNSPNPTDSTFSRSFDTRQPSSMPPPTTMKTSSAPSSTVDPPTQAPTPLQTSFQALYDASSNLSTFKALLADSPSNMWESPNGKLWTRMEI